MRPLALVALLLVAGCGGVDEGEYERAFRTIVAEARDAGRTPDAMRAAANELRALEPPDEVAVAHRDVAAAFRALGDAEERGTEPSSEVISRLLAARRAFAERRYDIGIYGPLP